MVATTLFDGFRIASGTPYGYWLRNGLAEYAKEQLLDRQTLLRFGLNESKLENCLTRHISGAEDRGFLLWKLLHLALQVKKA